MKNAVFWNGMQCGCCKNGSVGGNYRLHLQGDTLGELGATLPVSMNQSTLGGNTMKYVVFLQSVLCLIVIAKFFPSSAIIATLMMAAISSFEMLVLTRTRWRNIPEDGVINCHQFRNNIT
jgi:hypothetical protein